MKRVMIATLLMLGSTALSAALAGEKFERSKLFLEQNMQDKDAEIKIEAIAGKAGLRSLQVKAPDGRIVAEFKAPDSKLGIRSLLMESPEPKNDGSVQADFPAGSYTFSGSTTQGGALEGGAMLSHTFPQATAFLTPRPEAHDVAWQKLTLSWQPVKALAAYVVVIEQEATGREIKANLSPTTTSFNVPEGFLLPETRYKLAIGTVAKDGNISFIETEFSTKKRH